VTSAVLRVVRHDPYVRNVVVEHVIDGDTFTCALDLGWDLILTQRCRLAGLNAPEVGEPGHDEARDMLEQLLAGVVTVQSVRRDKFAGRFDAQVIAVDGAGAAPVNVNDQMVRIGYAVAWDGRGKRPVVPWPPRPNPDGAALAAWHPET
jgi:endonuclease YncB( thermonuclease family)